MLLCVAMLLAVPPQTAIEIRPREISENNRRYSIALRYPEIPNAPAFAVAVRGIVQPAVDHFLTYFRQGHVAEPPEALSGNLSGDFTAVVLKTGIVSVLLRWEVYVPGTAHAEYGIASVNYDALRDRILALADLFRPGIDFIPRLSELAIESLLKREYADADWVRRGAGPDEENFKVFTLTDTALTLHFPTYRVAPGVDGPQEVEIPFSRLRRLLKKQ